MVCLVVFNYINVLLQLHYVNISELDRVLLAVYTVAKYVLLFILYKKNQIIKQK